MMPPCSLSIPPRELTRALAARDTLTPNRLSLSEPVVMQGPDCPERLAAYRAMCRSISARSPPRTCGWKLYADPAGTAPALALALTRGAPVAGAVNGFTYTGRVIAARPRTGFTVRDVPYPAEARVPTEPPLIRWQE
jgi:hypothetical protein